MKLSDLDHDTTAGTQPLRNALRWLQTCLDTPAAMWEPAQRIAAQAALDDARRHLETEPLQSAGFQYKFTSPYGIDWRPDMNQYNGQRPAGSREIFVLAVPASTPPKAGKPAPENWGVEKLDNGDFRVVTAQRQVGEPS